MTALKELKDPQGGSAIVRASFQKPAENGSAGLFPPHHSMLKLCLPR